MLKEGTFPGKIIIATLLFILFTQGCACKPEIQYVYQVPESINDGIEVGTLSDATIDPKPVSKAVDRIHCGKYGEVHSLLIYKDGILVLEEYFSGHKYNFEADGHRGRYVSWNKKMPHAQLSASKSITSTCIGLAVKYGYIDSVDQSIFDFLPDHQQLRTEQKDKITIQHLLTMTSGLAWDEWGKSNSSRDNDILNMWYYSDAVSYVLEKPLLYEPGTKFTYSGGNMNVIGEILRYASGMDIAEFSEKYLFEPLGIESGYWSGRFQSGAYDTSGSLYLTSRDMLKIGILYLQNGLWEEERIISEDWVEKSSTVFGENENINIPGIDDGKSGYSYSWWIYQFRIKGKTLYCYGAGGWGGQEIMIFPGLNSVIIFTGGNYLQKVKVFHLLRKYILPAMIQG